MKVCALQLYHWISDYYTKIDTYLSPVLGLLLRLWMANIFLKAGLVKIANFDITIDLFMHEYQVPFFPPSVAAYLATAVELTMPILLIIGLLTRPAALALFIMTCVIQFTYLDLEVHYYWMILLSVLIVKGPGVFSFDYVVYRKLTEK